MGKSLISMVIGFIFISALSLTAYAQMCGCMGQSGGSMQGRMMEGMDHKGMNMTHGMGGMQGGGMMMDAVHPMWKQLMGLGLDEKQKEALKTLRSKTMKDMVKMMADRQVASIELKDILDKDPVDLKAAEASVKKSESLKTDMFLAHIKAREQMKSILTPDQRKRLKEAMDTGAGQGCGMMGGDMGHKDMPMHEPMK